MIEPHEHVNHTNFDKFTKQLKAFILGSKDNFSNLSIFKKII